MNPHLFVYGTLLRADTGAQGLPQRQRLHRAAEWLGDATMQGQLYDLGRYPGLVVSEEATDWVYGEVVRLVRPAATLGWLDAYEGLNPEQPAAGEYDRREATVRLVSGQELVAWVYVYQRSCPPDRRLPGGRWLLPRPALG